MGDVQRDTVPESRRRSLIRSSTFLLACGCLSVAAVHAEDSTGNHAVRGAGLIDCERFVEARAAQSDAYLVVAAWVDGYITGINQHAPDTYDVLSFESTELLMALLDQHCKQNPADPIFGVLDRLFSQLWPDRLIEGSDKIELAVGEREGRHYAAFIARLQQRLKDEGFYAGDASGEFTPATIEGISRYQKSVGLEATGFPDQTTLWRLIRSGD
jgi:AcrR family transcriptional regulator